MKIKKIEYPKILRGVLLFMAVYLPVHVVAQAPTTAKPPTTLDTSKMSYNQISSGLKLYVFPTKGQSNQQQKVDEYECYKWAMQQSGMDPLNMPEVVAAPAETGPDGKVVGGAAKGAIVGTAIGAVTGEAGTGAAVGAIAGGVGGIRQKRMANASKEQQTQAAVSQQKQSNMDSYKKAFSACIEGKGYTIK